MILLLWLSLLPGIALADTGAVPDHIFAPAPALQKTKYAADCGGDFPDLAPLMPPIDAQKQSPWCATFSSKALLDYFYNRAGMDPNYENRISTMDLNAANRFGKAESIGRLPDFRGDIMPNAQAMLEGAQLSGSLYREEDLPFDQSYFDSNGDLARLSAYYELQRNFVGKPELIACRDQSEMSVGLEKQFVELATVLAGVKDKEQFFLEIAKGRLILPVPRTGARKIDLNPPFDIRSVVADSGNALVEELQKNLRALRPTAVGICAIPMMKLPGLRSIVAPGDENKCGPHQVVVVGMRKINGTCQVEIRNSWGTTWPEAGGGNAWLPLKDFLKISLETTPLVSISQRESPGSPKNQIDFPRMRASYTGETRKLEPNGKGILNAPNAKMEGLFVDGKFTEGTSTEKTGNVFSGKFADEVLSEGTMTYRFPDGGIYKGQVVNGLPNGKGSLTGPGPLKKIGLFREGVFFEGIFAGPLVDGSFYEGQFKDNGPHGKGKAKFPDGSFREGNFRNGRFISGHFKGLLDAAKGLYYDGKLENGIAVETNKYTDRAGNPWQAKP